MLNRREIAELLATEMPRSIKLPRMFAFIIKRGWNVLESFIGSFEECPRFQFLGHSAIYCTNALYGREAGSLF
jgi:hypothetical protein